MKLVRLSFGRAWAHPLLYGCFGMAIESVDGLALELLGLGGPKKRFLTHIPFAGKESWSV